MTTCKGWRGGRSTESPEKAQKFDKHILFLKQVKSFVSQGQFITNKAQKINGKEISIITYKYRTET